MKKNPILSACLQGWLLLYLGSFRTRAFSSVGTKQQRQQPVERRQQHFVSYSGRRSKLHASSEEKNDVTCYEDEETLLQVNLSVLPDHNKEEAVEKVQRYCQSFPFAAVLPVQPLTYLPTTDGGVEVKFLRKKTKEKGSMDGGVRFFVSENDREGIEVLVKRNSEGQTVPKMFSEKLVVQAFVKGIAGETPDKTSPAPVDVVVLESVFHKWLDV